MLDELGWEFVQIYGLTETSPLVTINRQRAEWDDLTHERARPPRAAPAHRRSGYASRSHADGEVLTASNHNLEGYWDQPDATAEAQAGGWFHTGDGGILDEDGYLIISDRKKDVIISGGENVSSIEVEDALMSHPAVTEVAVIGIPDEKWGELVTALVVADGSGGHCRGPDHALPGIPGRLQMPQASRVPRPSCRAPRPASSRSSSFASPTGRAASARSTDPRRPTSGWLMMLCQVSERLLG